MGILLGNILFGCVSALIAHSKARNALGWFIAGCFIGPFAVVVVLLPAALKEGVNKKCPHCSEIIQAEALICHHCRMDVRSVSST